MLKSMPFNKYGYGKTYSKKAVAGGKVTEEFGSSGNGITISVIYMCQGANVDVERVSRRHFQPRHFDL